MSRNRFTLALLLVAGLAAGGCHRRSADPLDWKMEGSRPAPMQQWLDENGPLMPQKLQSELVYCVDLIRERTKGDFDNPSRKDARVCAHLDGLTIREVLIEGYGISHERLDGILASNEQNLVRLLSFDSATNQKVVAVYQATIDHLKSELAANEKRVAELQAGRASH